MFKTLYVTDECKALYAYIVTPSTKFSSDGTYSLLLEIDKDTKVKPANKNEYSMNLMELLDTTYEAHLNDSRKKDNTLNESQYRPYTEDPDNKGKYTFKLKKPATNKSGKDNRKMNVKVDLFDTSGKSIYPLEVSGGSRLKVAFRLSGYANNAIGAGVSAYIDSVQIIDLHDNSSPFSNAMQAIQGAIESDNENSRCFDY